MPDFLDHGGDALRADYTQQAQFYRRGHISERGFLPAWQRLCV
jgi:hypothetical protein